MKTESAFDLPELLNVLGTHLTQGSLYQCIQVSKPWNATFLPHLWRTFTEEHIEYSVWGQKLTAAIQTQTHLSHELEWFKDVYRRHAKYIRHLTINTPTMLDACLEGAFAPSRLSILPEYVSTGSSGTTTTVLATTVVAAVVDDATTDVDVGGSLLTNLESLTVNVVRHAVLTYFPVSRATGGFSEFNSFSTNPFGASSNNTNNTNNSDATTDHTATPPYDREQRFVKACQRLILNNPRLRTLSSSYSEKILEGLQQASSQQARHGSDNAALKSLKHVSYSSGDILVPKLLPSSVTSLRLWSEFGLRSYPHTTLGLAPNVHERLESLEVIYVESCVHLTVLLAQAPYLKTLVVNSFAFNYGVPFGNPIAPSPAIENIPWPLSRVTVLKCQQSRGAFVNKLGFDGFLKSFPMLVEYRDDTWYPDIAAQLVEHCPLLEIIRIRTDAMGARGKPPPRALRAPIDDSVSSLLSSLSRLRVLDIPYESIKAETMLESPWVCLDLEEFWCQIAEVPFLTDEEEQQVQEICQREAGAIGPDQEYIRTDEEDEVMELSEICVSTRKSIFTQLSKLTSLKFLSLSPDFRIGDHLFDHGLVASHVYKSEGDGRSYIRYDDVLSDTLYFRLDNGLDQLASLTKLEYLSFESMDHRMEITDIEWFASHLPRLREMRGLVTENHVGMEPDPKNDALIALIRRLRPDVVQKQTFGGYFSNAPQTTASRFSPKTRSTTRAFRFRGSRPTNN
ncbi:hypothetical protein EC957_011460 [Mortierella hygrophila]|uniref:Uncharacterized protein n=1 Tax=Mortierella hygrophila TaxID=979708 RepID=A0A9P6FHI3_9FUNG|nr:hypothetical protein EC957_011460 [Mortierella hygrophila]